MPSIDERVVSMAFENAVFEQRVSVTMTTLSKLNTAIANTGQKSGLSNIETDANKVKLEAPMSALDKLKAKLGRTNSGTTFTDMEKASDKVTLEQPTKALDNLKNKLNRTNAGTTFTDMENAANKTSLSGLTNALDGVKGHLTGLETAAAVAFGNIASQAAMKGATFAKSFALGPIKQGFQEYQTNLGSIQTILANTQDSGGNLKTVNAALGELNKYSDKTIYNFSEMARNIGTFTAAGVKLKPATESIKGISNLAALSGSNSQQASTAMYQLSQAISSGKVGLQDWNSVVNAGMGGAVFQKALMRTAGNMGTVEKGAIKIDKATGKATINGESFRESISAKPGQKSWLTSDVLVKTLGQFTGDMTDAQLAAQGFTKAQIKSIQAQAKTAQDAATQVKTLPQVFDVARETIGSGWAKTFQTIFGDFGESKKTFTQLSNTINGFINTNANARNKVLGDWKELGGRTVLISGIKQAFKDLIAILKPIKDAFREVFPAKTGKDLYDFTVKFRDLMKDLEVGKETANNIKRTFAGFFAVLHIGWTIIKDVGKVLFDLLGIVGKGSGGLLNFTGGIGDFLVGLDKAISKGNALGGFFKGLEGILRIPIELIKGLASAIAGMFGGFDGPKIDDVGKKLDGMKGALSPLANMVSRVKEAWKQFSGVLNQFKTIIDPWFQEIKAQFSNFGNVIADAFKGANFDKVLLAFQTTFLGGIFVTLKKALGGGKKFDLTGGLLGSVKETLGAVTGQLTAMQKNVQAKTLLEIAAAVVILAGGIYLLSTIEPKKMASSLTAIAVGLGELGGAMKIMEGGKLAVVGMPIVAASLLILAGAVVVLAAAMKIMATMSWEEIGKGLAGVGGALAAVGVGMKFINPVSLIPIAAGLVLVGAALIIIATAMKIFSQMKWEELAKGLVGLGGGMLVLAAGLALMGPSIIIVGPGLVAAAIGMTLMAGAVSAMGAIDPKKMLSGILGLGLALAALGIAIQLLPPTVALQAAGLILVSIALTALAGALKIFGGMKISTLAKGIISMGLALGVLAVGMALMVGSAAGAAAFLLAAAGLAIFVPALALMGTLPWGVILKGIAALALSLGVIAVVGLVAAPALLALGGALVILGAGLVLIGTAIYIAAKGLALLGENGAKGIGVLVTAITAFVALLPSLVINFVKGLVSIVEEVAKVAPKVVTALASILTTVFAFVTSQAPKMAIAVTALITAILNVIAANAQPMITAGWKLIQSLLSGVSKNIGSVVTKVGEIITKFLNSFATQAPRIVQAGARVLGSFLGGIATALPTILASAAKVVGKFLQGVTNQIPGVVAKGAKLIITFLNEITKRVPQFINAGARLIISIITGIGNADARIISAGVRTIKKLINGIAQAVPDLVDSGFKAIIRLLNGIERAIRNNSKQMRDAGWGIADAIIDGMVDGLKELWHKAIDWANNAIHQLPKAVRKVLGIGSPSKVFAEIGRYTMMGLAQGLADNHKPILNTATNIGNGLIGAFTDVLQVRSPSKVLKEIGKEVVHGFRDGLDGSAGDIRNAFKSLRDKINTEMGTQRSNIKQESATLADLYKQRTDKLNEIQNLRSAKKPDNTAIRNAINEANGIQAAINKSEKTLHGYQNTLGALNRANSTTVKGLQVQKNQLILLSKEYDDVSKKLDDATKVLEAATQERDNAIKNYADQYSQTPDIDSLMSDAMANANLTAQERMDKEKQARDEAAKRSQIDQVANYKKALADQVVATQKYQDTLQRLREAGLDDATYKKLLAKGLSGQEFASQLLASGKAGIDEINRLDSALIAKSTDLAKQAGANLYQAGVNAAQGLVNGLIARKATLDKVMGDLGDLIVRRIKKSLGIKSPSKEFALVGKQAVVGLANGLNGSSKVATDSATAVGDAAKDALTKSLAIKADQVSSEMDTEITITPVLDLSKVQQGASKMQEFLQYNSPVTASVSADHASSISTAAENVRVSSFIRDIPTPVAPATVHFEQNNYSPDPLSNIEIYRQTNNQMSLFRNKVFQV